MSDWQIRLARDKFTPPLDDPEFRTVVKLARAANAVLFCQLLLIEDRGKDSPQVQRIRMNALLYLCPLLYELFDLARVHVGRDLRNYPAFEQHFRPIFRDRSTTDLLEGPLKRVRNEGVFHFSSDSIPNGLAGLERETFNFLVADGKSVEGTYHSLADEAVVHAGFGVNGTTEEIYEQLRLVIKQVADLSARFAEAAEQLIAEVLLAKGWELAGDVPGPEA